MCGCGGRGWFVLCTYTVPSAWWEWSLGLCVKHHLHLLLADNVWPLVLAENGSREVVGVPAPRRVAWSLLQGPKPSHHDGASRETLAKPAYSQRQRRFLVMTRRHRRGDGAGRGNSRNNGR